MAEAGDYSRSRVAFEKQRGKLIGELISELESSRSPEANSGETEDAIFEKWGAALMDLRERYFPEDIGSPGECMGYLRDVVKETMPAIKHGRRDKDSPLMDPWRLEEYKYFAASRESVAQAMHRHPEITKPGGEAYTPGEMLSRLRDLAHTRGAEDYFTERAAEASEQQQAPLSIDTYRMQYFLLFSALPGTAVEEFVSQYEEKLKDLLSNDEATIGDVRELIVGFFRERAAACGQIIAAIMEEIGPIVEEMEK